MNKYVDNIYLINMDKDKDRLINVTNYCNELNIKFKRFSGIDPKKLLQKEKNKYLSKFNQYFMPYGIVGCAYSHIYIWLDAIKNNYKNILILEDDILFKKENFYKNFKNAYNELPNDYDIFFIGYKNNDNEIKNDFKYIYQSKQPFYETHSYIISLKGCNNLIKIINNNKINNPIDHIILNNKHLLNIYLIKNVLTYQDRNYESNITPYYFSYLKYNTYRYGTNEYLFRISDYHFNKLDILFIILSLIINLTLSKNISYILSIIILLFIIYDKNYICSLCYIIGFIISILIKKLK
jgi:GR25 family glycosyltransferase involved in LPS biosynthesis